MQKSSSSKNNQNVLKEASEKKMKLHVQCRSTDPNNLKSYDTSREKKNDASKGNKSPEKVTV